MPNAAQYRDAASRYRLLGENCLRQAALMSGWRLDAHLAGPVADAAGGGLRSAASHLSTAGSELARLARVCDGRALICDEFARRVREWLALDPMLRITVPVPEPPYPWVSAA